MKKHFASLTMAAFVSLSLLSAQAATVQNTVTEIDDANSGASAGPDSSHPLTSNLLQQPNVTISETGASSSDDIYDLNDLTYWSGYTDNNQASFTVTVDLDTTDSTLGFDLTNIQVYSGQGDAANGNKFTDQDFELSYSTTADPTNFNHSLGEFSADLSDPADDTTGDHGLISSLTSTISTSTAFASGVADLQFTFLNANNYGYNQPDYREIEVFGVDTVPEPSASAMLLLGAGLMVILIRRHQSRA